MFCIIFFKTIPNILLLLFLSPEFNKICLNEERNCIAETNILNKSFEVSFNIYVWWYIYIYIETIQNVLKDPLYMPVILIGTAS